MDDMFDEDACHECGEVRSAEEIMCHGGMCEECFNDLV